MINAFQIETFKLALGMSNTCGSGLSDAELIEEGDNIFGGLVETHETLADHVAARGRKAEETHNARGFTLHVWHKVQFRPGQARRSVYYMSFGDIAACMAA